MTCVTTCCPPVSAPDGIQNQETAVSAVPGIPIQDVRILNWCVKHQTKHVLCIHFEYDYNYNFVTPLLTNICIYDKFQNFDSPC